MLVGLQWYCLEDLGSYDTLARTLIFKNPAPSFFIPLLASTFRFSPTIALGANSSASPTLGFATSLTISLAIPILPSEFASIAKSATVLCSSGT